MKSGNTRRVARNSLLCFFMALVAGFLIACGGGGGGGVATPRETPNAPARPAAPSASAQSESEILVTWSAVSRATIYNLYRSPSSGGTYSLVEGDISARRYLDRGLSADTEYFYQLEACNAAGCSSRSPEVPATTQSPPADAPARPAAPSASAQSESEILVTWSAVSRATIYNLYRSPSSGGTYSLVAGDISALRYRDNRGLAPNTEYYYQLEACNSDGCSDRSPEVSATTRVSPPAPSASAQSESEILVTWSAVSDATSYKLYWSTSSGGPYTQVGGDITALRYRDNRGLAPNTEYYYQLEACNSDGCSRRSPEVSATTRVSPPAPSVFAQSESEILVTWSAVPGATSYNLYRSASKGGMYSLVDDDISALRYLDSGRYAGYYYQLEACNSGGCSRRSPEVSITQFSVYLSDAAAEGVEYSGPTGKGLTGKGGVFLASEGVFEFSIGATTLGSVRLNSDWANNEVTPSDFIDVDDATVISIARVMQGLDENDMLQDGISISQNTRENAPDLFADNFIDGQFATPSIGGKIFMIPPKDDAMNHLAATRRCLFSGGYVGSYRSVSSEDGQLDEGQVYYAVEPFANRAKRVEFSNVRETNDFALQSFQTSTVGVIGSVITLSLGNELSFVTPRLVTGIWRDTDNDGHVTDSGIHRLTLAADTGNPGATRRIVGVETTTVTVTLVGVETTNTVTLVGMYVLDYFEEATVFRGRHYDVDATGVVSSMPLSLTIANRPSWPVSADGASDGMTTVTLTLSGMRGEEDVSITVGIVRATLGANANENYGRFKGVGNKLSGTWCDIGGSVGSTVSPTPSPRIPPAPSASAQSDIEIEVTWIAVSGATSYNLYRSPSSGGSYTRIDGDITTLRYLDSGRFADTEYSYQLEACNSGGCSGRSPKVLVTTQPQAQKFPVYLSDAAVEGAEYSGPTSNGLTEKGGVFMASEGVFEFSIGGTALGSVRISRDWDGSQVTPADFIGVDEEKVIDIARIMQGLDEDGNPQNGISISQRARTDVRGDLFDALTTDDRIDIFSAADLFPSRIYTIPSKNDATDHFVATRKCLFSGGYTGGYLATSVSYSGTPDEGRIHYVLEPFANRIRGVEFSDIYPEENDFALLSVAINVGAIGSVITLAPGNELSFVTPRLITGIWTYSDESEAESGTNRFNRVAGNPGATRRVVGVETDDSTVAIGLYAIDYFADDGSFRGQYYDVRNDVGSPLSLTIAGGGSWPAATGMTTTLTLSGTLGEEDTAVTVEVVRKDENYGSFERGVGTQELSGTWCDIGGATGVAVPPPQTPPAPSASARSESEIEITWSAVSGATRYYLYRSTSSGGTYTLIDGDIFALSYRDNSGLSANTEYYYQLEACNSVGCSGLSPEVSVITQSPPPPIDDGQCSVGQRLMAGESCEWKGSTFMVGSDGSGTYGGFTARGTISLSASNLTFIAMKSGNVWEIQQLG